MRHRNIDNLFALFLIVCLGVFVADLATAQTQPEPITITLHTGTEADIPNFARAEYWELKTSGFLRDRNNEMEPLKTDLKIFTYALSDAYDTRLNEIISGTGSLGDLSVGSALASSLIKMRKNNQIWEIKRDMAEKYAQIAKQQLKINDYASDYDKVYAVFEAWWKYRRKSPSNTVPEQSPDPTSVTVPDPLSLECENECGVSWSASPSSVDALITKATTAHKKTCDEKPHKDYEYWACPDGNRSCDKSYEHYVVCNGKCGKEAPPTYEWMILLAHSPGKGEIVPPEIGEQTGGQVKVRTTIASHRRYCEDPTTRLTWNGKCNTWYYNCHVNYDSGMRTSCPMTGTHRTHDDGHWYDESSSISPSSGTSSAAAGSSYTVNLTTSTAFSSVYWYIKSSGTSGLGSSVETDNGGSSSKSASMTYTFGSSDSGDYIITAYIYNYSDNTTYQVTHTVSVSGSSSSDATPNCSDCTSHCSSPCRCTNSGTCNGTVSAPSTPSTPPPSNMITCDGCGDSYRANHPNVEYLNNLHRLRTCRFSGCGNSWRACSIVGWSPYCNNPYRKSKGWKCGAQ